MQTSRDLNAQFKEKFINSGGLDTGGGIFAFFLSFPFLFFLLFHCYIVQLHKINKSKITIIITITNLIHNNVVDLTVLVLCTGSWPLSPPSNPFTVPQGIEKGITLFQQFYQNQHSGRKLHWLYHFSKAELKANFCKHSKAGHIFQVCFYVQEINFKNPKTKKQMKRSQPSKWLSFFNTTMETRLRKRNWWKIHSFLLML